LVQTDEERKAKIREYYYKNKKKRQAYSKKPEVKAKAKEYYKKNKIERKRYQTNNAERIEKIRFEKRLKILQVYSKRLSNSDIPCCRCCGENFHIDFLSVDHIAGRREMDSELELKKLGYSSKLARNGLMRWIINNNFPDGFQILCTNCNFAKGMKKNNNTCPHETERKEETFARMEEQSSFEV